MDGAGSVPTGMVSNPTAAPILFDRALLRARIDREDAGRISLIEDERAEDRRH